MEQINEQSVWTERISARRARDVARALKAAGYKTATIDLCRDYAINVARYFEPGDPVARREVLSLICEASKIQPKRTD